MTRGFAISALGLAGLAVLAAILSPAIRCRRGICFGIFWVRTFLGSVAFSAAVVAFDGPVGGSLGWAFVGKVAGLVATEAIFLFPDWCGPFHRSGCVIVGLFNVRGGCRGTARGGRGVIGLGCVLSIVVVVCGRCGFVLGLLAGLGLVQVTKASGEPGFPVLGLNVSV